MSKRCMGCMELYDNEYEICPFCGYVEGTKAEEAIHLEPGTLLHDRYFVGKVLGYGGFGVTYIGWDGTLEQKVAIKEYLPSEFSTRMPGQTHISVFGGDRKEQFSDGLKKFIDEARRLAKFQNEPGIVCIYDAFEDNDTAYIIMEYLEGETLAERLNREKRIPEDEAVEMLLPVMNSLKVVHEEGIIHRDIAPDNIFITKDGDVKLIDFGASRYATTSHSRSLSVIIKPGYSPEEQYRSRGDQGPHTDVYALAGTLYKMITGKTPPDAMERRAKIETKKKDILEEPSKLVKDISVNRENAILNAMNIRIEDRTPDVDTFIEELNANPPAKRRYGKIKKIDVFAWPLWAKIAIPSLLGIFLVFGILLATGVIHFDSLFTDEIIVPEGMVSVPDVEGMEKETAFSTLENAELLGRGDGTITSDYIEPGVIVLQNPSAGTIISKNAEVSLKISAGNGTIVDVVDGTATIPFVEWETQENAIAKILASGLGEPEIEYENSETISEGLVIRQEPAGSEKVPEGTKIKIIISIGPAAFEMPNVVGMTEAEAGDTLLKKNLNVAKAYQKSDTVAEGSVISQSVSPGTAVKRGDSVTIVISSGKATVQVPNVVGMTSGDASATLKAAGFKVSIVESESLTVEKGYVMGQSPDAGSSQIEGTTVTILVSKGTKMISVPDLSGMAQASAVEVLASQGLLLTVSSQEYNENYPEGSVISQTPSAGSSVKIGTTVSVVISKGPQMVTVSFNGNGGSASSTSGSYRVNGTYSSLPSASRDYYTFTGWYTEAEGGSQVTASSSVISESSHTLYAHWMENSESDWVAESDLPDDAKLTNEKWTYTLTSYTTSDKSELEGWKLYDTKSEWGPFGDWSGWQDESVTSSESREVESKQVAASYNVVCYVMTDYNALSYRGYYSYRPEGVLRAEYHCTWSADEFNSAAAYSQGSDFRDNGTACYGTVRGNGTGYFNPNAADRSDVPMYLAGTNYKTQYRYRDRKMVYTYYYMKEEQKESSADPSGEEGVSNVKRYVKYIPK